MIPLSSSVTRAHDVVAQVPYFVTRARHQSFERVARLHDVIGVTDRSLAASGSAASASTVASRRRVTALMLRTSTVSINCKSLRGAITIPVEAKSAPPRT
jgi:hypothetical protein